MLTSVGCGARLTYPMSSTPDSMVLTVLPALTTVKAAVMRCCGGCCGLRLMNEKAGGAGTVPCFTSLFTTSIQSSQFEISP